MSISDTLQAKKYASIAEVAAAQAKVYADKLDNAPGYAEDAERFANLAGEYSDSAQSASASAAQSSSSAIQSAESAAESASLAESAAEQAIQQSIGTTLRGPEDEQISQLPAKSARQNTVVSFGDDGESELLSLTGFALLDSNGKVPLSNIPAAAITEVFVASSQAEMLASNAQPGDVVKRTDIGSSFILMSSPATTLSNWIIITDDVLAQLAAPGGVSLVNGAVSQAALSSSSGSTLSLSQVATAYGLDYSLGAVWSQGASTSSENWWLYGNKVYKSFSATTLSSSPNFDNFYLLSANGSFTGDSFGMSGSTTSSAKLSNIATVLDSARETLTFDNDAIISLSSNFDWSFSYKIREGVNVRVDSDSTATRDLNIVHSKTTIEGLVLGAGVNICINSTSSKLTDVKIINVVFDSGYIYTSGNNRGKRLCIKDCLFTNSSGAVANLISFKDWAYVLIENCRGYNPSNAAIFISPSYSYTCYKVVVKSNTFTSCSLYGIAAGGNSEIGCVNDIKVQDNTIQCRSTTITRAFALQWVSGAVFTGNNISAGIVVAAGACHDILFDGNTSLATLSPAYRKQNCSGWRFTNNKSYVTSSVQYHLTSSLDTSIPQKGRAGKSFYDGNTYYNGLRGIAILSGINNTIGYESFISSEADNTVGRIYLASSSFGNSVDGNQRIIAPSGAVAVTNSSSSSVLDGSAVIGTSTSSITAIVNGAVVSSLHGKTYHFTIDINNNLNNFWSAFDGSGTKKAVSAWASGVTNAKLAINASPFGASDRMQDSFGNGAPIPYTTQSDLTGAYAGLVVHRDGYMHCRYMPQSQLELNEFLLPQMYDYAWQSAFFNIPLIINGVISPYTHDTTPNPRTAIGQTASGIFHVVVVDGRNSDSAGCTTVELANYMLSQGCVTAFNLDGGGSSTIWYNGSVLNVPSDGSERLVGQAWVFR